MKEINLYDQYVLGQAKVVDTMSKEVLYDGRRNGYHTLQIWGRCFISTLVAHHMKIEEFIIIYGEFRAGNTNELLSLNILPNNLKRNKRLALKYIEALVYIALKRDLSGYTDDTIESLKECTNVEPTFNPLLQQM